MMTDKDPLRCCAFLLLLLLASPGLAQPAEGGGPLTQRIVSLEHRAPGPIREAVTPMLQGNGDIAQIGEHLVITAPRNTVMRIRDEISRLDTPPRALEISLDPAYGQDDDDADGDGLRTVTAVEGERVIFELPAAEPGDGDDQDANQALASLRLAMRIHHRGQNLLLDYGIDSGTGEIALSESLSLTPGHWHDLATQEADTGPIAIRITMMP